MEIQSYLKQIHLFSKFIDLTRSLKSILKNFITAITRIIITSQSDGSILIRLEYNYVVQILGNIYNEKEIVAKTSAKAVVNYKFYQKNIGYSKLY